MTLFLIITICIVLGVLLWHAIPRRAAAQAGASGNFTHGAIHAPKRIRVATYNIHGARGTDRVRDLSRTALVIRGSDVTALQEVRADWRGNQARRLGQALAAGWLFTPSARRWGMNYRGNGLLSRLPVRSWQTHLLPNVSGHRYRIYTIAQVVLNDIVLSVLFTHLHTRQGRESQLKMVLNQFAAMPLPAILLGDLNSKRNDPLLMQHLPADSSDAISHTLNGLDSADRVDWILTRGLHIIAGGFTPPGVSDHPYYWVDVSPAGPLDAEPATITP